VAHFYLKDDLMVFSPIPRGSATEKDAQGLRSGSERINSMMKGVNGDRCTLHSGSAVICWGIFCMAAILVRKVWYFMVKVRNRLRWAQHFHLPWHRLKFNREVPRWLQRFFKDKVTDT